MLSEEANNKEFKATRERFSRKSSRVATNTDLMRRLLCASDPVISSLRRSSRAKVEMDLPQESKDLVV